MMRARNFGVRNEVVEGGSVTKSQKGKKPTLRGEWESVFSGRHMDNVPQETHAVSVIVAVVRNEKDDRLLPHQQAQQSPRPRLCSLLQSTTCAKRKLRISSKKQWRYYFVRQYAGGVLFERNHPTSIEPKATSGDHPMLRQRRCLQHLIPLQEPYHWSRFSTQNTGTRTASAPPWHPRGIC